MGHERREARAGARQTLNRTPARGRRPRGKGAGCALDRRAGARQSAGPARKVPEAGSGKQAGGNALELARSGACTCESRYRERRRDRLPARKPTALIALTAHQAWVVIGGTESAAALLKTAGRSDLDKTVLSLQELRVHARYARRAVARHDAQADRLRRAAHPPEPAGGRVSSRTRAWPSTGCA